MSSWGGVDGADQLDAAVPAENFTAWTEALTALERELAWGDGLDMNDSATWEAPVGLGVLPVELLERARSIAAAQQFTLDRLELKRRETSRHLAAVRTLDPGTAGGRAVYLDVAG